MNVFEKILNSRSPAGGSDSIDPPRRKLVLKKGAGYRWMLRWFTLVELIVVITILAILATVGFLSLSGYSDDARSATVKANVRTVYSAILTDSTTSGNSPRYYISHDSGAALSGASSYLEGDLVILNGGEFGVVGTNYSAGNPRWDRLRMNWDKFKLTFSRTDVSGFTGYAPIAYAYSTGELSVGAVDVLRTASNGRKRNVPFFQVAGLVSWSKVAAVTGNYPSDASGAPGLIRSPDSSTWALRDGVAWPAFPTYPGCDTADVVLSNGQRWAACNAGATTAYSGQNLQYTDTGAAGGPTTEQKTYVGAYFQWGRNVDVTTWSFVVGPMDFANAASETQFITSVDASGDWLTNPSQNNNLWGGSGSTISNGTFSSLGSPAAMQGPCRIGYHVPTNFEWASALATITGFATGAIVDDQTKRDLFANSLRLPLAGTRITTSATYDYQGLVGNYWSSSNNLLRGGRLHLSTTQVIPIYSNSRANWFSVRCLAN